MSRTHLVSTKTSHLRQLLRVALGQEEIGRRIAQAREEAGLSQRELADKIGVADAQSVSRYERGITELTTKRLERIAEATGKPLGYFVQVSDGDQPTPRPATIDEIRELRSDVAELRARVDRVLELLLPEEDAPRASSETS